ncbi:unnamed protein product, partial [Phaeothamnion confervicola]
MRKRFGLIGTASQQRKAKAAAAPSTKAKNASVASAFGGGDSDLEEDDDRAKEDPDGRVAVNRRLVEESKRRDLQLKLATEADPNLFDYDGVYDDMKKGQDGGACSSASAGGAERKSKYIGNLLQQAKMREVEQDRVYERKLQREREAQDAEMGEAELKFVTSAYKKKLMEQKKWQHLRELEEEREAIQDVSKVGMSGFYSNLLTKNVAMGGAVEHATSAFTVGSKRNAATRDYEMQQEREERGEAKEEEEEGAAAAAAERGGSTGVAVAAAAAEASMAGAAAAEAAGAAGAKTEAGVPAGPSARMVDVRVAAAAALAAARAGATTESPSGKLPSDA